MVLLITDELLLFASSISQTLGKVIGGLRPLIPEVRLICHGIMSISTHVLFVKFHFLLIVSVIAFIFLLIFIVI